MSSAISDFMELFIAVVIVIVIVFVGLFALRKLLMYYINKLPFIVTCPEDGPNQTTTVYSYGECLDASGGGTPPSSGWKTKCDNSPKGSVCIKGSICDCITACGNDPSSKGWDYNLTTQQCVCKAEACAPPRPGGNPNTSYINSYVQSS